MPLSPTYAANGGGLPQSAEALLTPTNMTGGQNATLNPPGFVSGGCPYHHQRGHLIGNTLGGKNDLRNLVTLTDGSNHPYMFAIERIVKNIVTKTKQNYFYKVEVKYDDYSPTPNHTGSGALGNPYCQSPCPSHLFVGLTRVSDGKQMLGDNKILAAYDDAHYVNPEYMKHMVDSSRVRIQNGMYKQHSNTDKHLPNCPGLVSATVDQITCVTCGATGGTVAREPTILEWTWPKTCWHWCMNCKLNWCPTHGGALKPCGMFTLSRQCQKCGRPTQLFALGR